MTEHSVGYWREFRIGWRPLAAATLGMATGTALNIITVAQFAPALIQDFGWSKAAMALYGTLALPFIILGPIIGWCVDRFGVKRVASVGLLTLPLTQIAASFMTGSLTQFFALCVFQLMIGSTTTAMVYTRLVTTSFRDARGLALAIVASGGAVVAILASPLLGGFIDAYGWRAGYRALALFSAACAIIVYALLPQDGPARSADPAERKPRPRMADYGAVMKSRSFLLITGGLCLCNMPHALVTSQFKVMLLDRGLDSPTAAWIISLYSVGVMAGRFVCGLSLDRFPSHLVAAVAIAFPSLGFFLLASPHVSIPLVVAAVATMGMAQGAEIDLLAYMTARHFPPEVYGTVVSLTYGFMVVSATVGALLLSATLAATGSFIPFTLAMAAAMLLGGLLFLPLGEGSRVPALAH